MGFSAQDDVVQHLDLQELSRANQVAGHFDVGFGRRGIAAGMIMDKHNRRGIGRDGQFKDLARMHENCIQRSSRNILHPNQLSPRVEQDNLEMFHFEKAVVFAQQFRDAFRSIQHRGLVAQLLGHALRQRKRAF